MKQPLLVVRDAFEKLLAASSDDTGITTPVSADELPDLAFNRGRVLIQAPPGSGKTSLLAALVAGTLSTESRPVLISLRDLAPAERFWPSRLHAEDWLANIVNSHPQPLLLCIDGLDEVPLHEGQRLLEAVETVTRTSPRVAVIVTDRPGRRSVEVDKWLLATLTNPLEQLVTDDAGQDWTENTWAALPFYQKVLTRMPGSAPEGSNPASAIDALLRANGLIDESMDQASKLAFEAWTDRSSLITDSMLAEYVTAPTVRVLNDSGLFRPATSGDYEFIHMLVHGYLASRHLATRPELWTKASFEALTLEGATFEALGMLLSQVASEQVDELVRRVDNWNFYAAAYLLAEDFESERRTSPPLRSALLLLLGRRRFTTIPSTRIQVEDSLRLHGGREAGAILAAASLDDLVAQAKAIEHDQVVWWRNWQSLFTASTEVELPAGTLDFLSGDDAVLGWTAANVLAGMSLDESLARALSDIGATHVNESARWRAVHALAGTPREASGETFLDRLVHDDSQWVRNGALRSFIQVAAILPDAEARLGCFEKLGEHADTLMQNPKWLREVERATRIDPLPMTGHTQSGSSSTSCGCGLRPLTSRTGGGISGHHCRPSGTLATN